MSSKPGYTPQQQQQQQQHHDYHPINVPQHLPPTAQEKIGNVGQAGVHLHHQSPTQGDSGAFHGGSYSVTHRDTNAVLGVNLQPGAIIRSKPGAMIHMSSTVQLTGKVKFSMKKLFTGGDMAESTYAGPGHLALGPTLLGDIITLQLDGQQSWTIGKDAFLACTADVSKEAKAQGLSKALFSGEDLFVYRVGGQGIMWLTSFGAVDRLDLQHGEQHIVDNGHLVAWSCDYKIEKAGGGTMSSLKTGEGLVGSHYHFMETNPDLDFDRQRAYGYHLDLPAGEIMRFEPLETKTVVLVHIGGLKTIQGGSGYAKGPVDPKRVTEILQDLQHAGYRHTTDDADTNGETEACTVDRSKYAMVYGPTVGDSLRLGSTDLWVKVEKDYTVYGDECTLGCGKTIRDGMGAASGCTDEDCLDLVIINAVVIDWTGIFKADIGVKDGLISGIGKAGNPATMDGVSDQMIIGSNTDVIDAGGKILTAGGIDTHVHHICPQQASVAIASGITTLFGGGTGPSTSSTAVNSTTSKRYIKQMMQACDQLPLNYGIVGKGSDSGKVGLRDQCNAGVIALKLHEDFGCTPSTIDTCLRLQTPAPIQSSISTFKLTSVLSVCEEHDIQCHIHTDGLNEAGFLEHTAAVIRGRTLHVYHVEGAGGGHAPDVIKLVEYPNVLPSSTTPTMPFTINTTDEHIDMAANCHRLSKDNPHDASFLKNRIRDETIAAEDVLHDIGAISIMSSDSQAMGRSAEVLAYQETGADNFRVKRYISKYTINPALAQGISHVVGSVEVGKLADLVIWDASEFGTKPFQVLKKGFIAFAQMGDPNGA
ncbi:urease [Purpureocillium lavendulum]|uniref:Altered inheritance of mitochondria protein 24, mitochondrial n=1 Tax=Purpureocillium lavendulum TaxID=1247861 RepID=A0AB34G968_9HYPO|nr:urease [Purpureocillium lavendulum]